MNKRTLTLLCALSALLILGTGLYLLVLSPAGLLQENGPEEYMQSLLDSSAPEDWEARIAPAWDKPVNELEDPAEIFSLTFGTAARGTFSFREYEPVFRRRSPVYILRSGETDLCLVRLSHGREGWAIAGITVPEDLLAPETRSVSVLAPAGSEVFVNDRLLNTEYITEDFVAYADMQPLEGRFDTVPHMERWEFALYEVPEIRVCLNGTELPLQSRRGAEYTYAPTDAGAYSFRFCAPADAAVSINGATLSATDSAGTLPLPLQLNVSEAQRATLPLYTFYELEGLYSQPVISVTAADGTPLTPVVWAGETVYPALQPSAPEEGLPTLVETYLTNYCHFGAHHYGYDMLLPYVVEQGELWYFHFNAQASLQWIIGETLDIHELRIFDWLPLGSDLCLCSAHVSCTTSTAYETKDLELDYQLLCVRTEKGWRVQDMAYQ
ncbi:MAG: hypothetical protein E7442_03440 [Ruminococcaceae bacterium]|nr:hypothetical protein [Oscillospiraceae bacterium]